LIHVFREALVCVPAEFLAVDQDASPHVLIGAELDEMALSSDRDFALFDPSR
jgi:hypothetical protein